jgi:hypothetical protein
VEDEKEEKDEEDHFFFFLLLLLLVKANEESPTCRRRQRAHVIATLAPEHDSVVVQLLLLGYRHCDVRGADTHARVARALGTPKATPHATLQCVWVCS